MDSFSDGPDPGPVAPLAFHEEDTCVWCVRLREGDGQAPQVLERQGKRLPAPWMVPSGLPAHPAHLDG